MPIYMCHDYVYQFYNLVMTMDMHHYIFLILLFFMFKHHKMYGFSIENVIEKIHIGFFVT